MNRHARPVSLRAIFATFVALAMMLAPAMTHAGAAFAAMPDQDMQMMEAGHCQSLPSQSGQNDKDAGKSCCISICIGLAASPPTPVLVETTPSRLITFFVPKLHRPYLGEIATPPPRIA